jgi:EAL domain-containing protein (putative c-di-GMP-specific phosphodiesterase class I)
MYSRQFSLFSKRLSAMTVYFEPIVYLHPTQPYVWGWEALARDPITEKAPFDLFNIAELWGRRFQLELDMYFLQKAVQSYLTITVEQDVRRQPSLKNQAYSGSAKQPLRVRKEEMQPLSINVYPESLIRTRYLEVVRDVYLDGTMPLNKLTLEISEKLPLPLPNLSDGHRDPFEWFRGYIRQLQQFDVRLAIDDFGVGHASSERLSRLNASTVKIDRNALLYKFGDTTINYVNDFARNIPGYMQVIVEGVDYDSLFPLRALYDNHIRYVQGHSLGKARSIVNRLSKEEVTSICTALQLPGGSTFAAK